MTVQPGSNNGVATSKKSSIHSTTPVSNEIGIDYSFREITSEKLPELATKFVPRSGPKPKTNNNNNSSDNKEGEEEKKVAVKAVKLNNNQLTDVGGLFSALSAVVLQPSGLTKLDLSFNAIRKIPSSFSEFSKLKFLYVHGNDIHDVKHLTILGNFRELLKFSIHGNPLEAEVPEYKWFLLAHVPSLKQLNFTTLSTG
ncbi:leucine-rich repeat-containing protein 51-like, partial [Symsagittifera roscoffensis]|uniref:leucine-rich repeat-containing protein 51-like n=1 Tax=Symsagittifera roscoffensis TaxID=84072 RepID=UPI00307B30C2